MVKQKAEHKAKIETQNKKQTAEQKANSTAINVLARSSNISHKSIMSRIGRKGNYLEKNLPQDKLI